MLNDEERWVYEVPCVNQKGECAVVVVELTADERRTSLQVPRLGGDRGPIVNSYAMRHADRKALPGYVPQCAGIKRVHVLRLVN